MLQARALLRRPLPCNTFSNLHVIDLDNVYRVWSRTFAVAAQTAEAAQAEHLLCPDTSSVLEAKLASVDRWLVFSDLHVHQKYDPHWQEALRSVHDLASQHSAGVLFLVRQT
jgi:hypothetical protein